MTGQVEIITERLILRSVTPALIHDLYNTKKKEEIMLFFGVDEAGYERLKEMHEYGMETFRFSLFFFLLINKQTYLTIGDCGFHSWNKTHMKADLFYAIRNEADKQKGYMTETLAHVLSFGFKNLGLYRVQALIADWNIPSLKLLLKYGFTKEGTLREDYIFEGKREDSDCYSLLINEWKNGLVLPTDKNL